MLQTLNWEKIEYSDIPEEVKEFVREASLIEQEINFSNRDLADENKRPRMRRKLLDGEERIRDLVKEFNNLITKGYRRGNEKEKKKQERINNALKGLSNQIEESKRDTDIGITDEIPMEAPLQMYSNYLRKILNGLIYGSLEDAVKEDGEFYKALADSVWRWCNIQSFRTVQEIIESEEEEEEEEEKKISDEIVEGVGKIG